MCALQDLKQRSSDHILLLSSGPPGRGAALLITGGEIKVTNARLRLGRRRAGECCHAALRGEDREEAQTPLSRRIPMISEAMAFSRVVPEHCVQRDKSSILNPSSSPTIILLYVWSVELWFRLLRWVYKITLNASGLSEIIWFDIYIYSFRLFVK